MVDLEQLIAEKGVLDELEQDSTAGFDALEILEYWASNAVSEAVRVQAASRLAEYRHRKIGEQEKTGNTVIFNVEFTTVVPRSLPRKDKTIGNSDDNL